MQFFEVLVHFLEIGVHDVVVRGLVIRILIGTGILRVRVDRDARLLKQLREALEFQEFYLNKKDPDQIKLMDSRFHETLYKLSGSTAFYDTLVPLHKKIQKYRRASVANSSRAEASVAEHRKIYEAIESQNTALAAKYASEHVENAYKHIMRKD